MFNGHAVQAALQAVNLPESLELYSTYTFTRFETAQHCDEKDSTMEETCIVFIVV